MSEDSNDERSAAAAELPRLVHDEAVLRQALALMSDGYDVRARVDGLFELPETIYGYRPDVVGFVNGQIAIIVEVIKGSVDWPKRAAFERYASEHPALKLQLL